ncbi:MAG: M48 family metalloprotease [Paracoccaceae bacterium]
MAHIFAPLRRACGRLGRIAALCTLVTAIATGTAEAQRIGFIRDAEIERTLSRMSDPIFRAAGLRPEAVEIYIVNDRSLNAFVAGGARMFLHTGLLIELESPEETLGVIAHEAGHIAGGHQTRRMINLRNAQGPALIALLAGIAAGVAGGGEAGIALGSGAQGAIQRAILRYNRGEEASADQAALRYLEAAQIDPEGLYRVLERFRGQEVFAVGNTDPYILTHPLSTERMLLIEREIQEAGNRIYPDRPEQDYWYARMRAKLEGFLDRPDRVLNRIEDLPEDEVTLYRKAIALHRLPAPREALAAMDRLLALRPGDPFYLELKGQILHESGRAEAAVPAYRDAVRAAPNEPLLKAGLGRALLALDRTDADREALAVLQEARAEDRGDTAALRDLATAYSRAGDQGMATLATAERFALQGRTEDAVLMAKRASAILPRGGPAWLRAQDILALDTGDN